MVRKIVIKPVKKKKTVKKKKQGSARSELLDIIGLMDLKRAMDEAVLNLQSLKPPTELTYMAILHELQALNKNFRQNAEHMEERINRIENGKSNNK